MDADKLIDEINNIDHFTNTYWIPLADEMRSDGVEMQVIESIIDSRLSYLRKLDDYLSFLNKRT